MAHPVLSHEEIFYPESDGQPVAETGIHVRALLHAYGALQMHFQKREDVYVAANMFLYYEQGNPKAVVAPDVFVMFGTRNEERRTWRVWEEGMGPDFVLEVTSRSTRREDMVSKREVYRSLGVREYCQYDPLGEYLRPALQGLRLVDGEYEPMPATGLEGGNLALHSAVLGLDLRGWAKMAWFHHPVSGAALPSPVEPTPRLKRLEADRREMAARLERSEAARQAAEARVEELEARLRALQGHGSDDSRA